jgi:hypothetical protein
MENIDQALKELVKRTDGVFIYMSPLRDFVEIHVHTGGRGIEFREQTFSAALEAALKVPVEDNCHGRD